MRAFEVHAVDYLLKPFSAERMSQALARAESPGQGLALLLSSPEFLRR